MRFVTLEVLLRLIVSVAQHALSDVSVLILDQLGNTCIALVRLSVHTVYDPLPAVDVTLYIRLVDLLLVCRLCPATSRSQEEYEEQKSQYLSLFHTISVCLVINESYPIVRNSWRKELPEEPSHLLHISKDTKL